MVRNSAKSNWTLDELGWKAETSFKEGVRKYVEWVRSSTRPPDPVPGKRPSLTNVAYSVTKAAQLSLSRAWADLWAGKGVLVNAVAPGPVASELWMAPGALGDQAAAKHGVSRNEALAAQAAKVPLGRFAEPEEVARVCLFLCSELASTVTGAAWSADGGTVAVII